MEETFITVPRSKLKEIVNAITEIQDPKVSYSNEQIDIANEAIQQMKHSASVALVGIDNIVPLKELI